MNLTPVVRALLLVNILIFAVQSIFDVAFPDLMGLRYIGANSFQPHQIVTYFFVHADFNHLFSNMLALFFFGPLLEQLWGGRKFFMFYVICALGAGVLYAGVHAYEILALQTDVAAYLAAPSPDAFLLFLNKQAPEFVSLNARFIDAFDAAPTDIGYLNESKHFVQEMLLKQMEMPMVGASGAIFGILMAFAMIFPNMQLMLLFPPIPMKAKYLVAGYALYEFFSVLNAAPDDNVAHWAHLGGMFFAYVMLKIWRQPRMY
jgi:membrane associated rhomboid family serine protease